MPHEYVPWSEGRNFALLEGEPWSFEQSTLSPIARTALEVNLLTEDNLPSYHREVDRAFGRESAWGEWVNRWTAEEGRHAFCIRDYLLVTRGVDPDSSSRRGCRRWSQALTQVRSRSCRCAPMCRSRSSRRGSHTATPAGSRMTRSRSGCSLALRRTKTCT